MLMMKLQKMVRRFFARFAGARKPTPGPIARIRFEELRREQSRLREINPGVQGIELPFGSQLGAFRDENVGRSTTEPARRVRICVNRLRFSGKV
jgi:hypothetical protein